MTNTHLPRLHLLQEVAERYRISLRSLQDGARRKEIEHVHIGRERYMTDEQITTYLADRTVRPARRTAQRAADLAATTERVRRRRATTAPRRGGPASQPAA